MRIDTLEGENFMLQSSGDAGRVLKLKELSLEKESLERQVDEITEFLSDYGLKWLGSDD